MLVHTFSGIINNRLWHIISIHFFSIDEKLKKYDNRGGPFNREELLKSQGPEVVSGIMRVKGEGDKTKLVLQ